MDIIEYYDKNLNKEASFFFVDAKKAFDNVNWNFIFKTMARLGLGENFVTAIKAIYKEQQARLTINNELSEKLSVRKGTCQGCPLSLLLFILVLEVLLNQVREDTRLKGIKQEI